MYFIQEIQYSGNQANLTPTIVKNSRAEADSAFYSILSYAAISDVKIHSVIMYDEHGNTLNSAYYEH